MELTVNHLADLMNNKCQGFGYKLYMQRLSDPKSVYSISTGFVEEVVVKNEPFPLFHLVGQNGQVERFTNGGRGFPKIEVVEDSPLNYGFMNKVRITYFDGSYFILEVVAPVFKFAMDNPHPDESLDPLEGFDQEDDEDLPEITEADLANYQGKNNF